MGVWSRAFGLLSGLCVVGCIVGGVSAAGTRESCSSAAGPEACAVAAAAPFVTPAQARSAMTALWNTSEKAHLTKNAAALNSVTTGSQLLEERYALDSVICGCWPWPWTRGPRTIRKLTVFLPRQSHYPLYFMAQVLASRAGTPTPTTGNATSLLIVTRQSADQPWRIAMTLWDTAYEPPGNGFPAPATDPDGYDPLPPVTAAGWPTMLARFYTTLKTPGSTGAASPFLPGPLTTGTDLAVRRQGYESDGVVSHYAFFVSNPKPWLFDDGGMAISCGDVLETSTMTPARPHTVFVQHDGPGEAWGPDLDTGYYSKVIKTFEWPVCIVQLADGQLEVAGPSDGSVPIHDGGVPAKLSPDSTGLA